MSSRARSSAISAAQAQDALKKRQEFFGSDQPGAFDDLFSNNLDVASVSSKNCENLVGSVEIPVGVAGPLKIGEEEYYLPLATTEGVLVASVNRGCKALSQAGGVTVLSQKRGMSRAPVFACKSGEKAVELTAWLDEHHQLFQKIAEKNSQHLKFLSLQHWIRGRQVYARFVFDTDQAMGMNMVTIAVEQIAKTVVEANAQVKLIALSSNVCTDKKDSLINAILGRGYWVQAEAFLPEKVITSVLKTSAEKIYAAHVAKNLVGSSVAGSLSQNAQVANILAALYIATGQDPAHTVDGSRAFLTMELEKSGLYVALTLPSIVVGVVGGGTSLAAQTQARLLMKKGGIDDAEELARVVGAAALAGEISLMAALASGDLAKAHASLGRKK
ncbi:MAG: hydroxymethylglutaryl-CoA reductase [Candidatus Paceibacterota bacterium]